MKWPEIKSENKKVWFHRLWIILIAFLLYQVTSYAIHAFSVPRRIDKIVEAYPEQQKLIAEAAQKGDDQPKPDDSDIKGKLFVPLPGKPPIPKCTAILGDSALINDKWMKAGQEVNGAKIVEVFPQYVLVTRDGQEHKLVPFDVQVNGNDGQGEGSARENGGRSPRNGNVADQPQPAQGGAEPAVNGGPEGRTRIRRGRRAEMNEEQRQMYERYQNASPEEQERMREEYRRRQGG